MINNSNISFRGQFQINKSELGKIPALQKIKFLKQKDKLIADFCPKGDSFSKSENGYILNIKDEKEFDFLNYLKQFGIIAERL